MKLNVYDFDGTIYDGDSAIDFFLYSFKQKKVTLGNLIKIIFYAVLFKLKIVKAQKFKPIFFSFLKNVDNITELVDNFWKNYDYKIKTIFIDILHKNQNNVIISASPEFLLLPISKRFKSKLIATKMDINTGTIIGLNCSNKEKVKRLNAQIKDYEINEFYSDSKIDDPLAKIAKKSYLVTKNEIKKWPI